MVAEWHELDEQLGVVKVRKKWVTLGDGRRIYWVPKYRKERDIPVPQALFARMKARRKRVASFQSHLSLWLPSIPRVCFFER